MYKMKPQSSTSKPAPSPTTTSRRSIRTPLPSIYKENVLHDTNNNLGSSQMGQKQTYRVDYNSQKYCDFPQLIELKLTQPLKAPHHSKHKLPRPWAAKPIDLNKQTLKPDLLPISFDKTRELCHERRRSMQANLGQSRELQSYNSQLRVSDECTQTMRFVKAMSTRERSETTSRDKTGSCKIALKQSVFPIRVRQCEQKRMAMLSEREEELLSTIAKEQDSDRFISIESYTNLVF